MGSLRRWSAARTAQHHFIPISPRLRRRTPSLHSTPVSWKVLITARTLNIEYVGKRALDLLATAGCELIHPPKCGPLTEAELLPQLEGIDAVFASMDKFTA